MNVHADIPNQTNNRANLIMELRGLGISDRQILTAFEKLPREKFVMPGFEEMAWQNIALPLENGSTLIDPYTAALILEHANFSSDHKILIVGTGSGYLTALTALLARRVFTIEIDKPTLLMAEKLFHELNLTNISTSHANGNVGWDEQAPFDRILVAGSVTQIPPHLITQLVPNTGQMIIPIGKTRFEQYLTLVRRGQQTFTSKLLAPSRFMSLKQN